MSTARNNEDDLIDLHKRLMALGKTQWKFIGRDCTNSYLGFRAVAGVGSILDREWVGDVLIDPETFYSGRLNWPRIQSSS